MLVRNVSGNDLKADYFGVPKFVLKMDEEKDVPDAVANLWLSQRDPVIVEKVIVVVEAPVEEQEEDTQELKDMTLHELLAYAEQYGIDMTDVDVRKKKNVLAAIEAAFAVE